MRNDRLEREKYGLVANPRKCDRKDLDCFLHELRQLN